MTVMVNPSQTKGCSELYGKTILRKNRSTEKQSAVPIGLLKMKRNNRLLSMIVYVIKFK